MMTHGVSFPTAHLFLWQGMHNSRELVLVQFAQGRTATDRRE